MFLSVSPDPVDAEVSSPSSDYILQYRQAFLFEVVLDTLFYGFFVLLVLLVTFLSQSHKLLVRTIFAIFVLRTLAVVGHIYILWSAFIKYGDSPKDSYQVLMGINDKAVVWINPLVALTCVLNIAIVDFIMIWRAWIICNKNWKMIIIPAVLNVAGLGAGLAAVGAMISGRAINMNTILITHVTLSVATTLMSTVFIIYRILSAPRLRGCERSRGAIEVMVESALLYSVASIVYMALVSSSKTIMASMYADAFFEAMMSIAPALIMLRVVLGRARKDSGWHHLSSGWRTSTATAISRSGPIIHMDITSSTKVDFASSDVIEIGKVRNASSSVAEGIEMA